MDPIRVGKVAGEKLMYRYGIGYCIWLVYDEENPDTGICIDFSEEHIQDMIDVLEQLKVSPIMDDVSEL